jgi:cell division protein FtsQ
MTGTLSTSVSEPAATPPGRSRWSRRRALVLSAAVLVVVALVVWLVAFSPVLGVSTIRVQGVHALSAGKVIDASGVRHGEPLVRVDTGVVEHRIAALPDVASVTVRTAYPHTLIIDVIERVAVGYLADGSRYVLVDHDGVRFRTVTERPARLPLFQVPVGPQQAATDRAIAQVAAALPAALRANIASVQAFDENAITLLLIDQRVVAWGSADRTADKAAILPTLLTRPGTQYDVSNPDSPFVR